MDTSYTYANKDRAHMMIYVDPAFEPPDEIMFTRFDDAGATPVKFMRLSDASLTCEPISSRIGPRGEVIAVPGDCKSPVDCHRRVIGECQCGRHEYPVRFSRATPTS